MTTPPQKSLASGLRGVEGDQKEDPVEDQDTSNTVGMESLAVNEANHEGGERPTAIEHGLCDWAQPLRSALVPHFLPSGSPKIGPEQDAGQQSQEDGCGWMDGMRPSQADERQDCYQPDTEVEVRDHCRVGIGRSRSSDISYAFREAIDLPSMIPRAVHRTPPEPPRNVGIPSPGEPHPVAPSTYKGATGPKETPLGPKSAQRIPRQIGCR